MAVANVVELQDEVERILRRMSVDETKEVAVHLQIEDIPDEETQRDVLRRIQNAFDAAADDEARNVLLRGLPIPEAHRENYDRVFAPPVVDVLGNGQNVGPAADQVVPQVNVGAPDQNNGGDDDQNHGNLPQNSLGNAGGLFGVQNAGFPQLQQGQNAYNVGGLQAGVANAGALNAGVGGANMNALYAAAGANHGMRNPVPGMRNPGMRNPGPGMLFNAVGANAGGGEEHGQCKKGDGCQVD